MNIWEAVKVAARESGINLSEASRRMGRSRKFINNAISDNASPNIDTAAIALASCGYSLCAVKDGITITISESVHGESYADMVPESE